MASTPYRHYLSFRNAAYREAVRRGEKPSLAGIDFYGIGRLPGSRIQADVFNFGRHGKGKRDASWCAGTFLGARMRAEFVAVRIGKSHGIVGKSAAFSERDVFDRGSADAPHRFHAAVVAELHPIQSFFFEIRARVA